jgi:hypothetical protein
MNSRISCALKGLAAAFLLALLLAPSAQAQAVRRLILTDGSYQSATEWTKSGDRVKYFSAERGEWEEIPSALVDWKATDQWNAERDRSAAQELKQVTEAEIAARKEAMLNTPLVAPDLRLPADGGVFVLEELAGKPVLHKLDHNRIQIDDNVGKNMLKRAINPVAGQVQTTELKGSTARVRLHSPVPMIFVDEESDQGLIPADSFRIVRLERRSDTRVLARSKTGPRGESVTEKFIHSRAEKFSGDWWKIIPLEDLTPGEYALVPSSSNDDSAVWDFGVDK